MNIDFIGKKNFIIFLSTIFIIASILLPIFNGLNLGIDFSGGIIIEAKSQNDFDLVRLRNNIAKIYDREIIVQHFGSEKDLMIKLQKPPGDENTQIKLINKIKDIITRDFGTSTEFRKIDFVGPKVGKELIISGLEALIFAIIAILIYIWFRFEWQFGLGAIMALTHDAILTIGFYSISKVEFNLTSIAALLTIIGYSINDTVVIYDRIRENLLKFRNMDLSDIINKSINETLSRSIKTSGTTILAIAPLTFFGGGVLEGFSVAVIFGIFVGTISSIYISSALLLWMPNLKNKQKIR